LEQKKQELRKKLERSEAELNRFRRGHNVLSVEKGENIVVDRLVDLNKQLTQARSQRIEAESLYRTVENKNFQDIAEIMRQGLVQQLKANISTLEAEKARAATIFKPDHPRIHELNQQIASARQALNNEVTHVVSGIKSNYAAALAKERALESEAAKQQQDALAMRELGVQYTVLQEEVNANRSLFEGVLKRLSETAVSNDLAVSNMQIAERAAKPTAPSGPNVATYLIASMLSGLLLGIGWALLREFVSSNVGTPDDVRRAVGLATLGVIPHTKFLQSSGRFLRAPASKQVAKLSNLEARQDLIINHSSFSIIAESYRNIRTSLLLAQAEKHPQIILVTSPSPGEGKTATSLNLAIALAQDGHSVLLVDGDMRKGICSERLGLKNHRGLSNVLTGGLSLRDCIQQTPVPSLSLLSRGVTPPNPSELLGSRKMTQILNELREQFEFIVMDSPPVIGISDAAILSVIADGVLLIFNGQTTSTAYAQKAVERLDSVHARMLGVVLNAVNLDDPHYAYYHSYSSYYEIPNGRNPTAKEQLPNSRQDEDSVLRVTKINQLGQHNRLSRCEGEGYSVSGTLKGQLEIDSEAQCKIVSPDRLGRLVGLFAESIGPVAALVIRDQIRLLGESEDAFPRSRLGDLIKLITPEILNGDLRLAFESRVSEEIRGWDKI
jgi:capsular exopolysaccharide synthesis family protein